MSQGWIGIDLDGTLAEYWGWVSELHIGPPIPRMVEHVKHWLSQGTEVRIFTARVASQGRATSTKEQIVEAIEAWCLEHIGQVLPVTATKDYGMLVLYDDRCIQVEMNTGRLVKYEPT